MAKDLVLREYQQMIVSFLLKHKRANIFASPGMGKTSSILTALSSLKMLDDPDTFPVLIFGTKRIANAVWDAEIAKWDSLKNLTVSKVLGNPEQRKSALRKKADIYVINYENALWLSELFKGSFPFKTIVCDESTKIRGHRVSTRFKANGDRVIVKRGTKNAAAIVRRAFQVERWVNLTGTPSPKGCIDLWSQQFPIDFGEALGLSYTDFMNGYFRLAHGSTPQRPRYVEMPYAQEQITKLISPNTLMLDAYDWFDVAKPVEIDVEVTLSDSQMKEYKTLEKESMVMLESTGTVIETANVSIKCRQYASGAMLDEEGNVHPIHDEKILALKDLMDSTLAYDNVIVAYHFRSDLAALQKAFPDAVVLPSDEHKQKIVEDKWNKGEIKMLLLHPQSAGHGLNLQYGGNNMVIFTPDWNAEYYDQVIERIGPVRQAQAGFKRLTYIYRLVTRGTWDQLVIANLKTKFKTSHEIRKALTELQAHR